MCSPHRKTTETWLNGDRMGWVMEGSHNPFYTLNSHTDVKHQWEIQGMPHPAASTNTLAAFSTSHY
jgi:hypothetical protein